MFKDLFKRKRRSEYNIPAIVIIPAILISLLFTGIYLKVKQVIIDNQLKVTEKNKNKEQQKVIFNISEITLFSSASASQNNNDSVLWDLNMFQYTNIGIKVNTQNTMIGKQPKNTIKKLFVDEIKVIDAPNIGNVSVHYKNPIEFASSQKNEENLLGSRLDFDVLDIKGTLEFVIPHIYTDGGIIALQYLNSNITENFIINEPGQLISFDGSLLKRPNINLDDIRAKISININIINELNELYVRTLILDINLKSSDGQTSIYTGHFIDNSKLDLSGYNFYFIENP
jgi:hypothetical protein